MQQLVRAQGANLGQVTTAVVPQNRTSDAKAWNEANNTVMQKRSAFILFMNPNANPQHALCTR